jgi:hypothetical protein
MIPVWLTLQSIAFALWAFTAFRILFHLRRRGVAMIGNSFPGPLTFLHAIRDWLRDPAERTWRLRLAILTLVLIGLSIGFYTLSASRPA